MFQIRDEHMQGFESVALDNFEERGVSHFREHLPDDAGRYSDAELRERIRRAASRCKTYELTSEQQIMCFADAGLLIGENFDTDPEHPWAAHILHNREVPPEERASAVMHVALSIRREELDRQACLPRGRRSIYFFEASEERP
jgi:hypothetical protein